MEEKRWLWQGAAVGVVLGVLAGIFLAIPFLAVLSVLLLAVWFVTIMYLTGARSVPRTAVRLFIGLPVFVIVAWIGVVVSVWGFLR